MAKKTVFRKHEVNIFIFETPYFGQFKERDLE